MEKRYQIFVSSTYEDLQEERQEVIHALLELDCIPSGMELFPAANEEQWSLIKKVIDDCDYYIVIIGGRYGSIGPDGISYTEMEYRYALDNGKPIIAFLHKDPESLIAKKTEKNSKSIKLLSEFKSLAEKKMCKYWNTPSELGSVVSRSLIMLIKNTPAIGWIRADQVPSKEATQEILDLRKKIDELERELESLIIQAPPGSEELSQGNEKFKLNYTIEVGDDSWKRKSYRVDAEFSWNEIFGALGPIILNEDTENSMKESLNQLIRLKDLSRIKKNPDVEGKNIYKLNIGDDDFQTIKVQLRALGLINKSVKQRSVKDQNTYWTITPYGDEVLTQLRAIKKMSISNS